MPAIQDPGGTPDKTPVTKSSKAPNSNADKKPGIPDDAKLTVAGGQMTPAQRDIADRVLQQFAEDNASAKATKAGMVAAIGESTLSESAVDHVYHTHKGVFQSYLIPPDQVETQAHYFMVGGQSFAAGGAIGAVKDHPDWTVGQIAAHVEISDGSAAYYDGFADEADAIIAAWGGEGGARYVKQDSSGGAPESYQFTRGGPSNRTEDSWTAATRTQGEVDGWELFAVANRIYYFSDDALLHQKPIKIIDRERDSAIIVRFAPRLTSNKLDLSEATLTLICELLDYHAGECIIVSGYGPFDRRWIVSDTRRSRFQPQTELSLIQAAPKGTEPAHGQSTDRTGSSTGVVSSGLLGDTTGTPKDIIDKIVLPVARQHGINVTAASVTAANARHGPTSDGARSDHQGPPSFAWAADMSNSSGGNFDRSAPTPEMDALAKALAKLFEIPWTGSGLVSKVTKHYRFQLIYRTDAGGGHWNHVHFGVKALDAVPDTAGGN